MNELIDRIAILEKEARKLEPSQEEREAVRSMANDHADTFINSIEETKAYFSTDSSVADFEALSIQSAPHELDAIFRFIKDKVDHPGINPASGGHLGYIPGGGIFNSAIGDYLADVTNNYSGVYFGSPGAVQMENYLIEWMGKEFCFGDNFAGNLTSGGSIANLIAMVAARDAMKIDSTNIKKCVIYTSSHVHHCIQKSLNIAGLREIIVKNINLDDNFKISTENAELEIVKDLNNGLKPVMIIASAGTTDVGAIDHLEELGNLAKKHKIWYHIDGAYGGFFYLTAEGKKKLKGIDLADSLVIDPHKGLFLPYGLGTVLVKDKKHLLQSNSYDANYMQDALNEEIISPADVSPELTKHFRGLRLWLPLMLHGTSPFIACLDEKLALAQYFHHEVQKIDGIVVGPEPELSVVTYRYEREGIDNDEFNKRIIEEFQEDGRVFISSTMLNDIFTLRLAILSFRSHKATIDLALTILKEKVEKIKNSL